MKPEFKLCELLIKLIDAWKFPVKFVRGDNFCGNVEFVTENGYTIIVFNDCGQFDYLDSILYNGELLWDYGNTEIDRGGSGFLENYRPSDEVEAQVWKWQEMLNAKR